MKTGVRAVVAYVVGRLISGKESSSVYDFAANDYTSLGGHVSPSSVNVFDYTHRCNCSGGGNGRTLILFHYGVGKHVSLKLQADRFSGYDYDSESRFSGVVRHHLVRIYDSELRRYFSYSI